MMMKNDPHDKEKIICDMMEVVETAVGRNRSAADLYGRIGASDMESKKKIYSFRLDQETVEKLQYYADQENPHVIQHGTDDLKRYLKKKCGVEIMMK